MYSPLLPGLCAVFDILKTQPLRCLQKKPSIVYPSVLSIHSLLSSSSPSSSSSSYHHLPMIPTISQAVKMADLDKVISRDGV